MGSQDNMEERKVEEKALPDLYLSDFAEQMAQILEAGMVPEDGLELMREDSNSDAEKKLLDQMIASLQSQGDLSVAMRDTGVFPDRMVSMVEMGESTGHLDQVLNSLNTEYERQDALKRSVRNAVLYPILISGIMIVLIALIMIFVMPVFKTAYAALGVEMSGLQEGLYQFGIWLSGMGLPIVIGAVVCTLIFVLLSLYRSEKQGDMGENLFWSRPEDRYQIALCRFSGIMSLTYSAGLTTEDGIGMAKKVIREKQLSEKLTAMQDCTNQGQSFSEAVRSTGIFTSRELRRIEIAERTAKLDIVMQEIADDYQNRVDISAGRRVGRVEPVLIAVLSLVAGLILLSVMLPLLSIMSTL